MGSPVAANASHAPLMIADAEGFFKAEGLDVEIVSGLRAEEAVGAAALRAKTRAWTPKSESPNNRAACGTRFASLATG